MIIVMIIIMMIIMIILLLLDKGGQHLLFLFRGWFWSWTARACLVLLTSASPQKAPPKVPSRLRATSPFVCVRVARMGLRSDPRCSPGERLSFDKTAFIGQSPRIVRAALIPILAAHSKVCETSVCVSLPPQQVMTARGARAARTSRRRGPLPTAACNRQAAPRRRKWKGPRDWELSRAGSFSTLSPPRGPRADSPRIAQVSSAVLPGQETAASAKCPQSFLQSFPAKKPAAEPRQNSRFLFDLFQRISLCFKGFPSISNSVNFRGASQGPGGRRPAARGGSTAPATRRGPPLARPP